MAERRYQITLHGHCSRLLLFLQLLSADHEVVYKHSIKVSTSRQQTAFPDYNWLTLGCSTSLTSSSPVQTVGLNLPKTQYTVVHKILYKSLFSYTFHGCWFTGSSVRKQLYTFSSLSLSAFSFYLHFLLICNNCKDNFRYDYAYLFFVDFCGSLKSFQKTVWLLLEWVQCLNISKMRTSLK